MGAWRTEGARTWRHVPGSAWGARDHPGDVVCPVLCKRTYAAQGTFGEWLDGLPFEVAAATARLLKHYTRAPAVGREITSRPAALGLARQAPRPARWPRPRPAALTRARELPIRRAWIVGCDWHTSSPRTPEKRRSYTACLLFGVKIALPACEQTSAGRAGCCNTGWPPTGREGVCGLSVARCLPSFELCRRKKERVLRCSLAGSEHRPARWGASLRPIRRSSLAPSACASAVVI